MWATAAAAQSRLAVLEFHMAGADPCARPETAETCKTLGAMADAARGGALAGLQDGGAREITVMTSESLEVLLEDMGKGAMCVNGECEVQIARSVGADLVVSGQVVILEATHIVTLKLHETARGSLLDTRHLEAKGQIDALRALRQAASELVVHGLGLTVEQPGVSAYAATTGAPAASGRPRRERWTKPKPVVPRDPRTGFTLALRGDALVTAKGGASSAGLGYSGRRASFLVSGTYTAARLGGAAARLALHPFASKRLRPFVSVEGSALFGDELLVAATGSLGLEIALARKIGLTVEAPVTYLVKAPAGQDPLIFAFGAVGFVYRP